MQQSAGACVGTGRHFPVSICAAGQKKQCPFCPYRYALFVRTLQGLPQCHFYEYHFSRNTPNHFFFCRLSMLHCPDSVQSRTTTQQPEPGADGAASPRGRAGRSGSRGGSARGACVAAVAAELCASAASARAPRILVLANRHQCQRASTDGRPDDGLGVARHTAPGRLMPGG